MVTVMRPMLKAEPLTAQQGGLSIKLHVHVDDALFPETIATCNSSNGFWIMTCKSVNKTSSSQKNIITPSKQIHLFYSKPFGFFMSVVWPHDTHHCYYLVLFLRFFIATTNFRLFSIASSRPHQFFIKSPFFYLYLVERTRFLLK